MLELDDPVEMEAKAKEALAAAFRPEFLNRLDSSIIFHRLGREQIRGIVEIQLRGVEALLAQQELTLEVSDAARDLLADRGYEPAFGARPLKRAIQAHLVEPLSEQIIAGRVRPGDTVRVEVDGDKLEISPVRAVVA